MARRPGPGPCVHCLREVEHRTWDHVLPQAWYPDITPPNLAKWKIPSCGSCNATYGELERDLLTRIGLCIGPEEARASGISAKALRAIRPGRGRNKRDHGARAKAREKIRAEMFRLDGVPVEGLLPQFGPRPNLRYPFGLVAIPVSADALEKFGEKLVRGITYIDERRVIPPDYVIKVAVLREGPHPPIDSMLERHGTVTHRGPGFIVERARAQDDVLAAVFRMIVWGRLVLNAAVYQRQYESEAEAARVELLREMTNG